MKKKLILSIFLLLIVGISLYYGRHNFSSPNPGNHNLSNLNLGSHKIESKTILHTSKTVSGTNDNSAIDTYLKSLQFNGSALVIKNGKVLINKGYGYANLDQKINNNPNTVFYIASISKYFVSTCILQLQEQGKLNINDPVSKYLPNFEKGQPITLYNLLTHTSGIPERNEPKVKISPENLVNEIGRMNLAARPGTRFIYSDANYATLAYIVQKVSKEPYHMYVEEHIIKKLNLKHTGFAENINKENYQSIGYYHKSTNVTKITIPSITDFSQVFGCGDIYSTPHDLYLFDKGLYSGKIISKKSLKLMLTPYKVGYSFGLWVKPGYYVNHGIIGGYNTMNSFSTNGKSFVILFSNLNTKESLSGIYTTTANIYKILNRAGGSD